MSCIDLLRRDERGNVVVLLALLLPVLGAAVGATVDYARLSAKRAELQRAADSAALAGAKILSSNLAQPSGQRESAAMQTAHNVVSGMAPDASVAANVFLNQNAVQARVSEQVKLLFGGLLSHELGNVAVIATAKYDVAPPPPCVIALSANVSVGISAESASTLSAPNCPVWSNATGSTSITAAPSAKIVGQRVCAVGGGGGGTITPVLEKHCSPATDPFAGRVASGTTSCTFNNLVEVNSTQTLSPGVYCAGLTIQSVNATQSVNVTLSPGVYEVRNGAFRIQGSAAVTGMGVSVLFGSGGYFHLQGNPKINLTATTSGALAGLVIASDPSHPVQTSVMQGNVTGTFLQAAATGSIYLPNHTLSVRGSSELKLGGTKDRLVARSIIVGGSSRIDVDAVESATGTAAALRLTQ